MWRAGVGEKKDGGGFIYCCLAITCLGTVHAFNNSLRPGVLGLVELNFHRDQGGRQLDV